MGLSLLLGFTTVEDYQNNRVPVERTYDMGTSNGYVFGFKYDLDNMVIGFSYKGERHVRAKQTYDAATTDGSKDYVTEYPSELAIGLGVDDRDLKYSFELKLIQWSKSGVRNPVLQDNSDEGFAELGLEDQMVFAAGVSYEKTSDMTLMAGLNYGANPMTQNDAVNSVGIDYGDLGGYAVHSELHLTAGMGYAIENDMLVEVALTYALPSSATDAVGTEYKTSQTALTIGVSKSF